MDLLKLCGGLEGRLETESIDEIALVADLVGCALKLLYWNLLTSTKIQKGANASRADDTKSMKGVIIDWITPEGQPLMPPLHRKLKLDRGFNHERTGALLCPANVDWSLPS